MATLSPSTELISVSIRLMQEADLVEARGIFRVAFGTFLGVPAPEAFAADREYIFTRWRANPQAALVAEVNGAVAGSNFAAHWGSFGFFGPLTVRPELWNQHIAQKLLGPTLDLFEKWGVREAGLFTFAHSPKHLGLYQKFGFWPRFLTAIMSKGVTVREAPSIKYSALKEGEQNQALSACRELTGAIFDGLDVTSEIRSVMNQNLGETVLVWGGDLLDGFAVCHVGEGTEAGRNNCYIKFAAVRPGPGAEDRFEHLLDASEGLAAERGLQRIEAGVNLNRRQAYRQMLRRGFRIDFQGVAMHRPDAPAYNRPDAFVVDDWR
ncbi:MAG TPA: GNAT family N-acetyltransferase [Terriglobia bacterium]|nr:GNAT family N-acetyltransferase [Terriglobia bacterium]